MSFPSCQNKCYINVNVYISIHDIDIDLFSNDNGAPSITYFIKTCIKKKLVKLINWCNVAFYKEICTYLRNGK